MPAFGKIGRLGSFAAGITNRKEPVSLVRYDVQGNPRTMLLAADNVDIGPDGYLKRRRGQGRLAQGFTHSLWGDEQGGFVVNNGKLLALAFDGTALQSALVRTLANPEPLSYARMPTGDVYWTNGQELRRIAAGVDHPATTAAPNPQPGIELVPGGMRAGQYLVAFTRMGHSESPATVPVAVQVAQGQALAFTGMAADVVAYVSGPNGEVLTDAGGARCQTLNTVPMPAGQIVRHHKARLLVANGNTLWFSEPYFYGVTNPVANFIQFPGRITVMEPTDGGVFVCADQTYWLAGDMADTSMRTVLPYGGLPRSGGCMRDSEAVYWVSPRGLVVAGPDGSANAVQDHAIRFGPATAAAAIHREVDGQSHVVFTREGVAKPTSQTRSHPGFSKGLT